MGLLRQLLYVLIFKYYQLSGFPVVLRSLMANCHDWAGSDFFIFVAEKYAKLVNLEPGLRGKTFIVQVQFVHVISSKNTKLRT